jgi:hypothetical protein
MCHVLLTGFIISGVKISCFATKVYLGSVSLSILFLGIRYTFVGNPVFFQLRGIFVNHFLLSRREFCPILHFA